MGADGSADISLSFPTVMKGSLRHSSVKISNARLSKPQFIMDGKASCKMKKTNVVLCDMTDLMVLLLQVAPF